jgi:hypothetical protein
MGPHPAHAALAALVLAAATPAAGTVVGGGGSSRTDCLVVLDAPVNVPARSPRHVRCTDGDPACDADGAVNGVCELRIAVCANSTYNAARCTPPGVRTIVVRHAEDNGDPKFDPDFQALQSRIESQIDPPSGDLDRCTTAAAIRVPIEGPFAGKCGKGRKLLRIDSESVVVQGRFLKDRDAIRLTCDPVVPQGCDPQLLYTGTFDRIQRQIFNRSCAVSGCHDSQSFNQSGGLLLETGSSRPSLVNVVPSNGAAQAAGWKRVTVLDPSTGDPDTSFLVRKVNGDFPGAGFGDRMPRVGRRLDAELRDVITRWVAAGAPETGWVAGTD